jgi:sugar O-acyltransferase (sialic acid O-acetyltransferase NeuD family)
MDESHGVQILGAGGHAKVVVGACIASNIKILGIYDDNLDHAGTTILGIPVKGTTHEASANIPTLIAIGSNHARKTIAKEKDMTWAKALVHPHAWVAPSARLGAGTIVCAGAVVQPDATVGDHSIVNTSASIDHDCNIGSFVHIAPGVHLCGNVNVGECSLLGVGSVAIPGVTIGANVIVAAGATAIQPLEDNDSYFGTPAGSRKP